MLHSASETANIKLALTLFVVTSVVSIPSYAAENLCDVNLRKIDNMLHAAGQKLGGGIGGDLKQAKIDGMKAKEDGDIDKCIALTLRVLTRTENASMGGG
ncbi:hypothetical protein [Pseudomonas inefficax]|uniref:hypothetical protein n=1 Tax=Pseudomonas inefficax TaxID=2078786 RepID=UPI004046CACD